jgi:hypothetical protein
VRTSRSSKQKKIDPFSFSFNGVIFLAISFDMHQKKKNATTRTGTAWKRTGDSAGQRECEISKLSLSPETSTRKIGKINIQTDKYGVSSAIP